MKNLKLQFLATLIKFQPVVLANYGLGRIMLSFPKLLVVIALAYPLNEGKSDRPRVLLVLNISARKHVDMICFP